MRTFIIKECIRQELKREYHRFGMRDDYVDYHIDKGIWYRFAHIEGEDAVYEECQAANVPEHVISTARQLYPGALNP